MLPKKGFWSYSREGQETKERIQELLAHRPKNKQNHFYFVYCLIQKETIAIELIQIIADYQQSGDIKNRQKAFIYNNFLHTHFIEKDILEKPIPKEPLELITEEIEIYIPYKFHQEIVKQSPIALKERKTFPKKYQKDYGWPLNSEIVYQELDESEKVDNSLFDKDYYSRLDRRQFKSHDADGISTYSSSLKELTREELAENNPKAFTLSKSGIASRKICQPKTPKGQYLNSLGREETKKLSDFLEKEREELKDSFKGMIIKRNPDDFKQVIQNKENSSKIIDEYLERIKNGKGRQIQKMSTFKQNRNSSTKTGLGFHLLVRSSKNR